MTHPDALALDAVDLANLLKVAEKAPADKPVPLAPSTLALFVEPPVPISGRVLRVILMTGRASRDDRDGFVR